MEKITFDPATEKKIAFYVEKFGVDEETLRKIKSQALGGENIEEFGRFDKLRGTVDKK